MVLLITARLQLEDPRQHTETLELLANLCQQLTAKRGWGEGAEVGGGGAADKAQSAEDVMLQVAWL